MTIAERQIQWIPIGWDFFSRKGAVVRDGKLETTLSLDGYFVTADIDGAIEFLQAIKRAMAETRK